MAIPDTGNFIIIDPTSLDRNKTFALLGVLPHDEVRYDSNTEAITEHIAKHAFKWAKEAEAEGNEEQLDFLENVFLPDDYHDEGIWYDALGWRYDRNDCTVTDRDGNVTFDEHRWLEADPSRWDLVEEAARLASIDVEKNAGTIQGIAAALAIMSKGVGKGVTIPSGHPDQTYWEIFILEFAGENYENGERIC